MNVSQMNDSELHVLEVLFSSNEEEIVNLRTSVSSFITNLTLVCETLKEFGV